jgi:hypothetical protein
VRNSESAAGVISKRPTGQSKGRPPSLLCPHLHHSRQLLPKQLHLSKLSHSNAVAALQGKEGEPRVR